MSIWKKLKEDLTNLKIKTEEEQYILDKIEDTERKNDKIYFKSRN